VGLREPAATSGWPPSPEVPGQDPLPKYHGIELGQSALKRKET
jgi:hypothetical protein